MMHCECLDKIRNNGVIVGIKLRDLQTGQERTVNKDKLKALMTSRAIIVTNLKIDDAGRLVDRDTNDYQDELNRLRNNRKINTNTDDMTNKELLEHIKNIEAQGNSDIAKAFKKMLNKQIELENLIKNNTNKAHSRRRETEILNELEDIKRSIAINDRTMTQMSSNIEELIGKQRAIEKQEKETEEFKKTLRGSIMEEPDGIYDKYLFNEYLTNEPLINGSMTSDQLKQAFATKMFTTLENSGITPEILNELQSEIEQTFKAHNETYEMYLGALNDFSPKVIDFTLIGAITSLGTECVNSIPGKLSESLTIDNTKNFFKDIWYRAQKDMPMLNSSKMGELSKKQILNTFGRREELSGSQKEALIKQIDGPWNYAAEFVAGDRDWEVKNYVLQELNHRFFDKYFTSESGHNRIQNVDGEAKRIVDIISKTSKNLTERCLKIYESEHRDRSKLDIGDTQYLDKAYNISIISYFASKKFLYKYGIYPYKYSYQKEVLGALMNLTLAGMLNNGVSCENASQLIHLMINSIENTECGTNEHWKIEPNIKIKVYNNGNNSKELKISMNNSQSQN